MKGKKLSVKERREKIENDEHYRKQVFKELCDHVARGYSSDCFGPLSYETIVKYLSLYPKEFCEEEFIEAQRKGKEMWEGIGQRQSNGSCLGNSRSWFYNMAHRYKWSDRVQVENEHKGQVAINVVSYASTQRPSQDTSEH